MNNIQKYVELYSGPEAELHNKYALMINLVYIPLTYGIAMPIMFPVGLFGLVSLYILDRITFVYYYR